MLTQLKTSVLMLVVLSALTGFIYPMAVTGIAQLAFPSQANGSLIMVEGKTIGSELIGQPFDNPKYFWGRPSATSPYPYNAGSSSGSNLAVTNPAQEELIKQRIARLRESGVPADRLIPIDLVTASGSGLDPHISVAAARLQMSRVARARGVDETAVAQLVEAAIERRQFGVLGEPRVNVLLLNLTLDRQFSHRDAAFHAPRSAGK